MTYRAAPKLYAGLDIGQANDFTALAILQPVDTTYHLRVLQRVRDKPYPAIVAGLQKQFSVPEFRNTALAIDATGVGKPLVDYAREYLPPLNGILGVTITGGQTITSSEQLSVNLPKHILIHTGKLVLEQRRLKNLGAFGELADVLEKELSAYQVSITQHHHETYAGDQRQGTHDDLVFALCLAIWLAENWTHTDTVEGNLVYDDNPQTDPTPTPPASQPYRTRWEELGYDVGGAAKKPDSKWSAMRDLGYGRDGSHPDDHDGGW